VCADRICAAYELLWRLWCSFYFHKKEGNLFTNWITKRIFRKGLCSMMLTILCSDDSSWRIKMVAIRIFRMQMFAVSFCIDCIWYGNHVSVTREEGIYRPCAREHISEKGRWKEGYWLRVVRILFIEGTLNVSLLIVLEILWVWNTETFFWVCFSMSLICSEF
jgi:hypothetical protein